MLRETQVLQIQSPHRSHFQADVAADIAAPIAPSIPSDPNPAKAPRFDCISL